MAYLNQLVAASGLSRETYLRMLISGVAPKEAPPPDFWAMMRELHAIGNNLNQIAQYFHSGGFYSKSMQNEINRHLTALWQLRQEAIKLGGTYHGRVKTHRNKKR